MEQYNEKARLEIVKNKIIESRDEINQLNDYDKKLHNDYYFYLACYTYLKENINMKEQEYNGEIPTIKIKK